MRAFTYSGDEMFALRELNDIFLVVDDAAHKQISEITYFTQILFYSACKYVLHYSHGRYFVYYI